MTSFTHPLLGDTLYRTVHKSGVEIIVWPREGAVSAYAMFATRYGSLHNTLPAPDGGTETVPEGIAHYLEHKLFESEDGDAFARFSATGAAANAFTGFDRTAYLFRATENILPSLEILLDFVRHPYFTAQTVQKEQGIIGQEIRMCEDNPGRQLLFGALRGMYHTHPVRIEIAGTVDTIARITPELLYRCYDRYYDLHNMVLVVAGRITPEQVEETADRLLTPAPSAPPVEPVFDEPDAVREHTVTREMPVAAPLFLLAFKEPTRTPHDAAAIAAGLLLPGLIAGKTTPLYARLLAEGLINEEFEPEYFSGPGFGCWMFSGESADPERAAALIREETGRLIAEGIDPADFTAAQRAAYGRLVSGLEEPEDCCRQVLDDLIAGTEPLAVLTALAALTPEQINEHLHRRIPADQYTLSVIRPRSV